MSNASNVTGNWWMVFRCFPPEPHGLWRLYTLSICITLLLFLLAAFAAYSKHGWSKEPTLICKTGTCETQRKFWKDIRNEASENSDAATKRIKTLKNSRVDPQDKYFSQPWDWFEKEIAQLEKVIKKSKKYKIYSLSQSFLSLMASIFVPLIFYIFIGRLVTLHARSIKNHFALKEISRNKITHWMLPHVIFSFIIAIFMIVAEIFTSVLAQEKTWFGWSSFCVTPSAFIIICISYIGFGFVAATPFTMLWCVSRRKYIPSPKPSAPDGKFGAGRYVEFLQTWTLWLILAPATLGIVWLRYVVEIEPQFSPARLLHGLGVGLLITLIVIRLIRNAIILRFSCYETISDKKYEGADTRPIDPTRGFLGTEWWKLPATVTAAIASIWVLLEWLGIAKLFMNLIR